MGGNETAPVLDAGPALGDAASPGTGSSSPGDSPGVLVVAAPPPALPLASSTLSPLALTTTTTVLTTLTTTLGGGGGGGGGGVGAGKKGGKGGAETEDILPWILCFGIGLIVIWIGWMLRQVRMMRDGFDCCCCTCCCCSCWGIRAFAVESGFLMRSTSVL